MPHIASDALLLASIALENKVAIYEPQAGEGPSDRAARTRKESDAAWVRGTVPLRAETLPRPTRNPGRAFPLVVVQSKGPLVTGADGVEV